MNTVGTAETETADLRRILMEVVDCQGSRICNDPQRLEGFLRDLCRGLSREGFVLVCAARARLLDRLIRAGTTGEAKSEITRISDRLAREFGFEPHLARWAAETWALALGRIEEGELSRRQLCPVCGQEAMIGKQWQHYDAVCPRCGSIVRFSLDGRSHIIQREEPKTGALPVGAWLVCDVPECEERSSWRQLRRAIRAVLADESLSNREKAKRLELDRVLNELADVVEDFAPKECARLWRPKHLAHRLVSAVLEGFAPLPGLHTRKEGLPRRELQALMQQCEVPEDESPTAMIDFVAFGDQTSGMVFGSEAMYYTSVLDGDSRCSGRIAYSEFERCSFERAGISRILFGRPGQCLDLKHSGIPTRTMLTLLGLLQSVLSTVYSR